MFATEHVSIIWHFNPISVPYFIGTSEAGGVRFLLYHIIGEQIIACEELSMLLVQIEYLLNARSVCAHTMDPNDQPPVTS